MSNLYNTVKFFWTDKIDRLNKWVIGENESEKSIFSNEC